MHIRLLLLYFIYILMAIACNKSSVIEGVTQKNLASLSPSLSNKGYFRIQNVWKGTVLSNNAGAIVMLTGGSYWIFQTLRDSTGFCIKDSLSGNYLVDNGSGGLILNRTYTGNHAFWQFFNTKTGLPDTSLNSSNIYQIMNTHTKGYINIETGNILSGAILPGWLSAQWQFLK